jgi:hypothetical protein
MYTLGEKFRVLNTSSDLTAFDGTTPLTTATLVAAATKATTYFQIKGFGKFYLSNLTQFVGVRAKAATAEVAKFTTVAPLGLVLGNVIEARITLSTERYEGELANNYIVGSRPIIIQTQPLTAGVAATNVTDAIVAAYTAYKALFNKSNFVLGSLANVGNDLVSTIATGYEGVSVSKIEISISAQGSGSYPKTTLAKVAFGTYGTQGSQGRGLGKFLEESVRVGTADNVRTYGMNASTDTSVDLRGSYTQFNWRMTANYDMPLGTSSVDNIPTAEHNFTLFLNEATCMTPANNTTSTLAINLMSELVLKTALLTPVATDVSANNAASTTAYTLIPLLRPTDVGALTTITFTT